MKLLMISAAIAGLAAAPALGDDKKVANAHGVETTDTSAAAIVADCNARKFETSAEIEKDGRKRIVRLKLCAAKDEDAAAWVKTLRDAKTKIAGHPEISEDSKAKITAEFDAEIARVETSGDAPASPSTTSAPAKPLAAPATPSASAMAPELIPTRSQTVARPQLTINCLEQGERGDGGPCTGLERFTRLAIRADADLAEGVRLRFLRRGDVRGEVVLTRMRQGQTTRLNLPPKLCAGVANSKVEIQILGSNRVVETLGPYLLRC